MLRQSPPSSRGGFITFAVDDMLSDVEFLKFPKTTAVALSVVVRLIFERSSLVHLGKELSSLTLAYRACFMLGLRTELKYRFFMCAFTGCSFTFKNFAQVVRHCQRNREWRRAEWRNRSNT